MYVQNKGNDKISTHGKIFGPLISQKFLIQSNQQVDTAEKTSERISNLLCWGQSIKRKGQENKG